jgi:hypothetical protein
VGLCRLKSACAPARTSNEAVSGVRFRDLWQEEKTVGTAHAKEAARALPSRGLGNKGPPRVAPRQPHPVVLGPLRVERQLVHRVDAEATQGRVGLPHKLAQDRHKHELKGHERRHRIARQTKDEQLPAPRRVDGGKSQGLAGLHEHPSKVHASPLLQRCFDQVFVSLLAVKPPPKPPPQHGIHQLSAAPRRLPKVYSVCVRYDRACVLPATLYCS